MMTREEILAGIEKLRPWFHCIELGSSGLRTKTESAIGEPVEHPQATWEKIRPHLPEDLSGKSLLDVGCNAGFYAVEAKRRGAARVLGVDAQRHLVRQARFVRRVLDLDIEFEKMSVYDLDPRATGQFDITLALGLVYHLKHLVLGLEKLFHVTRELLILETAIFPPERSHGSFTYPVGGLEPTLHPLAYVENPPDSQEAIYNWFLPGTEALRALLRNVGFDEVSVHPATQSDRAVLVCRKREPYPDSRVLSYLSAAISLEDAQEEEEVRSSPGEELRFRVRVENTGFARWLAKGEPETDRGAVHLAAHLLGGDGEDLAWYYAGAFLPRDLAPGEAETVELLLRAPEIPGQYWLEFDMVAEHLAWFEDLGSPTLRCRLSVE
jgi:tRNA (mo5U34)-methyltransferase